MTSGTFPGQREIPVSLFKGSPVHSGGQVWGIDTDFSAAGTGGKKSQECGGSGSSPASRACCSLISSGEHREGWKSRVTAVYGIRRSSEPDC